MKDLPKFEYTINAIVTNTHKCDLSVEDNKATEITSNSNGSVIKRCNETENGSDLSSKRSKFSGSDEEL